MIVVVTGSRHLMNISLVRNVLYRIEHGSNTVTLYHGNESGLDSLAKTVAYERGWTIQPFPADWKLYGNAAGPRRNITMIDSAINTGEPVVVLAFPALDAASTFHCMQYAVEKNLPVLRFDTYA